MQSHPPTQDEVLQAFHKWLDETRSVRHIVVEQPDKIARERPEVDYVLAPETGGRQIAVEVSSAWRSARAGKEDRDWDSWTRQVAQSANPRLPGRFVISTDLRISRDLGAVAFADELVAVIAREDSKLTELHRSSRGTTYTICGMRVFVSKRGLGGGDVSFMRGVRDEDLDEFPEFVQRVLSQKSPKLKQHKQQGRETWIVIYNTIWTVRTALDLAAMVRSWLGPDHGHVDQVAFVEGDPPDGAWVVPVL
jgi:hypothetical protein